METITMKRREAINIRELHTIDGNDNYQEKRRYDNKRKEGDRLDTIEKRRKTRFRNKDFSGSNDETVDNRIGRREMRSFGDRDSQEGKDQGFDVKFGRIETGGTSNRTSSSAVSGASAAGMTGSLSLDALLKAKKVLQKQKKLREKLRNIPLLGKVPNEVAKSSSIGMIVQQKPSKTHILRLDQFGNEVDELGNVINMSRPANLSTLKVNINNQKKDAFPMLEPELDVDPEANPYFDERMGINKEKLLRSKRLSFQFVEEGQWSKQAEMIKIKSIYGQAQAKELKIKQAQLVKEKAEAHINPNSIKVSERVITKGEPKDMIPGVEWWDAPLLVSGSYSDIAGGDISEGKLRMDKITCYVEHPLPIEPPSEPAPLPPQPLKLTKKEQKKLRTQRRVAKEKDRQEMIRQGLIEPPKAKIKMSNLMKVLSSEATQDPTRLEMEIRSAAAEREQAHVDRNIARKLTPAERCEKKERKLFGDPSSLETIVSVYKINDLSHPQTHFKVRVNATENKLTSCVVVADGVSVVVVEGGSKPIKRYDKLMLKRINWATVVVAKGADEDEDKPANKCVLVWQGSVVKRNFDKFLVHECRTEAAARKVFSDAGVPHYWDLSVNFAGDEV